MEFCRECGACPAGLVQREEQLWEWARALEEKEKQLKKQEAVLKKRKAMMKKKAAAQGWEVEVKTGEKAVQQRRATKRSTVFSPRTPQSPKLCRQVPPACQSTHINQLPDNVLRMIFTVIHQDELILHVRYVCQRWEAITDEQILSKKVVFSGDKVPTKKAVALIKAVPNLRSLTIRDRSDSAVILRAASIQSKKLLQLTVEWCFDNISAVTKALNNVVRSCVLLTHITLIAVNINNAMRFCQNLGTLPNLHKIEIRCHWFKSPQLHALLGTCTQMQELRAIHCECSDRNIEKLVRCWGNSLQVLFLNASMLTDAGLVLLSRCYNMQHLELTHMNVSGTGLHDLAALSQLQELHFPSSLTPRRMWRKFFCQSQSANCLRKVSFRLCSNLNNKTLSLLTRACPQLEQLDVSYCNCITGAGIKNVLRHSRQLQHLNVERTENSVLQVVPLLPRLAPQLQLLVIGKEQKRFLSEAILADLKMQMPNLHIV